MQNNKSCLNCKFSMKVHLHTVKPPHKWVIYCAKDISHLKGKERIDAVINPENSLLKEITDLTETCNNYQE